MSTHTSSCSHCGSPCEEHAFDFQNCKNDPATILDDIERMDMAIRRLHILKSQRYQQLNTIRSSTRNLPNEVLLSIFQSFCSLFEPQAFPQFILGGVCNHWRNLVHGTPQFWKVICLHVEEGLEGNLSEVVSALDMFRARNGASFEFIQLQFEPSQDPRCISERLLLSMRGVGTLSRIALHNPPLDLLQIIKNDLTPHDVSLSTTPYLFDLPESVPRFSLALPWSTLTNLKLSSIRLDICFDLLLGCPNLIVFSTYYPRCPREGSIPPNTLHDGGFHFPQLQNLTWHHTFSDWDVTFLSFYHFPALKYFCWLGLQTWISFELFRNFTSLLPQSCQTLHLSAVQESDLFIQMDIFQYIAHPAEQLICSQFYMETLPVALERLKDPTYIPSLTSFRWESPSPEEEATTRDEFIEIIQGLKNAIRGRKEISAGQFMMAVEGIKLPEGFSKESSYELMGRGFDFEIAEDGRWKISF